MAKRKIKFGKKTDNRKFEKKAQPQAKTMLMYPAGIHDGCTAWRMDWIRGVFNYSKVAQVQMTNVLQPIQQQYKGNSVLSKVYQQVSTVVTQRPVMPQHLERAKQYEIVRNHIKKNGREPFRFVIDVDDVVHGDYISKFNAARGAYADNKRFEIFKETVKYCDELHVCSPAMVEFYKNELEFDNVTFRPNFMPKYLFDNFYDEEILQIRYEESKKKPRIVWAGSATHIDLRNQNEGIDDFTHIKDFVLKTLDIYQWVFVGAVPPWIESEVSSGKVESHPWMSILDYPRALWRLKPTIIFAPLHDDVFNRCKSNIKLTEAGSMGVAGVFQNLDPYAEAPLKFDTADELNDQFKFLLSDWDNYAKVSRDMRKISEGYFTESNLELLKACYFTEVGSKEREIMSKKLIDIQIK